MKVQTIYTTMLSYRLKYRKNMEIKNAEVVRTENGRTMHL